jgi:hypothetical protein
VILYPKRSSLVYRVVTQSEPHILYQLRTFISSLDRNEMSHFGQSIHNNPYIVIPFLGVRQSCNEIHINLFLLPLGYL